MHAVHTRICHITKSEEKLGGRFSVNRANMKVKGEGSKWHFPHDHFCCGPIPAISTAQTLLRYEKHIFLLGGELRRVRDDDGIGQNEK